MKNTVFLKDLVHFHYGSALKAEDRDDSGPFTVFGSNGPVGRHSQQLVDYPTIIIGRKGSVGSVYYAEEGGWPIDTTYYTEILDNEQVHLRYLYYSLRQAGLDRHTIVTSIPGLNRDALYRTSIPLPRLPEQKRIANILDKADTIRENRRQSIEFAQNLLPSLFTDMFGSAGNRYEAEPLNNHLTFLTSGSRGWAEHYVESGKRFIRSLDVQMNRIGSDDIVYVNPPPGTEAERTRVRDGDVLVTITGSRIGRVAFIPESFGEAYVSQHVAIVRLKPTLRSRFCSMYLSLPNGGQRQIAKAQYGQTKPGLSLSNIREFQIPIPPTKLQDRFLDVWDQHDSVLAKQTTTGSDSEALFNTLVQRAFRGQL